MVAWGGGRGNIFSSGDALRYALKATKAKKNASRPIVSPSNLNRGGGGSSRPRQVASAAPVSTLANIPKSPILDDLIKRGIVKEGMPPEQILSLIQLATVGQSVGIDIDALMKQVTDSYGNLTGDIETAGTDWMQELFGNFSDPNSPMYGLSPQDPLFANYAGSMAQMDETADTNLATDLAWFEKQKAAEQAYYNSMLAAQSAGLLTPAATGGGGGGGGGGRRRRGRGGYGGGGYGSGSGSEWDRLTEGEKITETATETATAYQPDFQQTIEAAVAGDPNALRWITDLMSGETSVGGVRDNLEEERQRAETFLEQNADVEGSNAAWLAGAPDYIQEWIAKAEARQNAPTELEEGVLAPDPYAGMSPSQRREAEETAAYEDRIYGMSQQDIINAAQGYQLRARGRALFGQEPGYDYDEGSFQGKPALGNTVAAIPPGTPIMPQDSGYRVGAGIDSTYQPDPNRENTATGTPAEPRWNSSPNIPGMGPLNLPPPDDIMDQGYLYGPPAPGVEYDANGNPIRTSPPGLNPFDTGDYRPNESSPPTPASQGWTYNGNTGLWTDPSGTVVGRSVTEDSPITPMYQPRQTYDYDEGSFQGSQAIARQAAARLAQQSAPPPMQTYDEEQPFSVGGMLAGLPFVSDQMGEAINRKGQAFFNNARENANAVVNPVTGEIREDILPIAQEYSQYLASLARNASPREDYEVPEGTYWQDPAEQEEVEDMLHILDWNNQLEPLIKEFDPNWQLNLTRRQVVNTGQTSASVTDRTNNPDIVSLVDPSLNEPVVEVDPQLGETVGFRRSGPLNVLANYEVQQPKTFNQPMQKSGGIIRSSPSAPKEKTKSYSSTIKQKAASRLADALNASKRKSTKKRGKSFGKYG